MCVYSNPHVYAIFGPQARILNTPNSSLLMSRFAAMLPAKPTAANHHIYLNQRVLIPRHKNISPSAL
jgi:hypothetical protein